MFFSVIIPTYNRAHYLDKAIKSIINQSFNDWELIVIDDASTDNTEIVVKLFSDNRVKYIKNKVNKERCISRNTGILNASGKYVCFLDSDDYHLPNHLQKLYELIQKKKEPEAFFFANAWNEDMQGNRSERLCPNVELYDPYTYFLRYTVNPQRWCVHRSVFEKIQFDSNVIIYEDLDTSLRILSEGYPVFQLKERTTVYVQAPDSFTHGDKNKAEKELLYLKKIFSKRELRGKLPIKERWRLLSMCYYHMTVKAFHEGANINALRYAITSFFYCPKGYNGKTNKSLLVMMLYSVPFVGRFIGSVVKQLK